MLTSKKARVFSWILLICCFAGACAFLALNVNKHVNSDMSSELVLAEHLLREKKFLSTNWHYSTEVCVVGTHLAFAPFMLLFSDWYFVRIFGSFLLYASMLVSAYYVCRQVKMRSAFPFVGILLMLPLSKPYFDNILKGIHYIPYVTNSFALLGMMLHFRNTGSKKMRVVLIIAGALLAFAAGMEGMRLVLTFAMPAACAALILYFMERSKKQALNWSSGTMRFITISGIYALSVLGGCLLNITVLSKIYDYRNFSGLSFTDIEFPLNVVNDMIEFWGYSLGEVFSSALLHNVAAAVLMIAAVFVAIRAFREKLSFEQRAISMLYVCGMLIYLLVQACTSAPSFETYHLTISVFGFFLIGVFLYNSGEWKLLEKAVAWILVFLVIASGGMNFVEQSKHDQNEYLRDIAEYLVDDEYDAGYAAFWDGNVMKELSGGRFEMYVFEPSDDGTIDDIDEWMQEKSHATEPPEGKVFILVQTKMANFYGFGRELSPSDMIYEDDVYQVYGYDDYETMKWAMEVALEEYLME